MDDLSELPECPVCLQVYNSDDSIPRVLACGHSVCEACLTQLPQRFPNTTRCPSCNQLVSFPSQQGPSALPKNIDLLSFINRQNPNPHHRNKSSKENASSYQEFLPRSWSEEFYSEWKDWILPQSAISIEWRGKEGEETFYSVLEGRVVDSVGGRWCSFRKNRQAVSLVFVCACCLDDSLFKYSYAVRIVEALNRLGESERIELCLLLKGSTRQFRIGNVCGIWMDLEDGYLYLVCERFDCGYLEKLIGLGNRDGSIKDEKSSLEMKRRMSSFALIGMELCEALIGFHSEGMVSGCLSLSCFSFDVFGRAFVELNEILVTGRRVRKFIADAGDASSIIDLLKIQLFVSPELLVKLLYEDGDAPERGTLNYSVGCCSDVWSLACFLVCLLLNNSIFKEQFESLYRVIPENKVEKCDKHTFYHYWIESASTILETLLGAEFESFHQILRSCLDLDPGRRPCVTDVWRCIRELIIEPEVDVLASLDANISSEGSVQCLTLGDLCAPDVFGVSWRQNEHEVQGHPGSSNLKERMEDKGDLIEGICLGKFKSINLQGHMDCISGLAIGGGFLFSSSFDKTIRMWSLQDFSYVQSFKGHEHRITGIVFVDMDFPFCISVDIGGGIFVWNIDILPENEPVKKWYEQKDWRYSGIHALAISGTKVLYTGSGDKSIKAWSLQDYTLMSTMNGHKSVVSCLAVCEGVLYSGSWDGTICLWSLNDHSPLTVLGDEKPGNLASVLSLSVDHHMIVAAYESGHIKLWRNDLFSRSINSQDGSGTTLALYTIGKWLFMGGWNKTINIQEISGDELQVETKPIGSIGCDSVVTALLFWEGKLFAGFADRVIKVFLSGM